MSTGYQPSRQWDRISREWLEEAEIDLATFKSGRPNHKISLWNPETNGVRFLKTLVYNLCTTLTPRDWERLGATRNRDYGDPIQVRHEGRHVCMDYLQATLEAGFLEDRVDLRGGRVMEIGAGYGRTCHLLLSNYDIASYHIVDLRSTLRLSREYLRTVLDRERYDKITFVEIGDVDAVAGPLRIDLCLNIDSFAEMNPETVRGYLSLIDRGSAWFYVKNPVGKYLDSSLDGHAEGAEAVRHAMETGLMQQVLDVHDSEAVRAAAPAFVAAYRPGAGWRDVANAWAPPWSFYWQALYRNEGVTPRGGRP
ncbi:putative sugar O-methyltransferase [Nonomuraea terrae]|uniref:putative sugar O-methyltransferase n=1 Tax=Nonomuraea terrae TaxID=2530383 RepID=UPI0037ACBD92